MTYKGWEYIPNIITEFEAKLIRNYNNKHSKEGLDKARGLVKTIYIPKASSFLMKRLQPIVEKIVGEEVYPTYWFNTTYYKDCYMVPHTDRPSCEIGVSLNIYSNVNWPLKLYDLSNITQEVVTPMMDGVLYEGTKLTHWRDKLTKDTEFMQTFCHFVRKNGRFSDYKYDRNRDIYRLLTYS